MSASASQSSSHTDNYDAQTSVQGASGSASPTLTSGGNLTYTSADPTVSNNALDIAGKAVLAVLSGASNAVGASIQAVQQTQQQVNTNSQNTTDANTQLLSQVLQADQQVAATKGTGGASDTNKTTLYLIGAAVGIAVLGIFAAIFLGRKSTA